MKIENQWIYQLFSLLLKDKKIVFTGSARAHYFAYEIVYNVSCTFLVT